MPDITKVQMIMDRLQVFFAKWLGEHLRRVYPKDFWEEGVLGVLTPEQRENALDDGAKCLDDLDFAALIAVFLGNFRLLRREAHLDAELSDLAKHVKKIRNLYAHKKARNIANADTKKIQYHIDTLHQFLSGLGADPKCLNPIKDLSDQTGNAVPISQVTGAGSDTTSILEIKSSLEKPGTSPDSSFGITEMSTCDDTRDWTEVAELSYREIKACLKFEFPYIVIGNCQCLKCGDVVPVGVELLKGWKNAIILQIKSENRAHVMHQISKFNDDIPVSPYLSGEYAVWQFPPPVTRKSIKTDISTEVFLPKWITSAIYEKMGLTYRTDCDAVQYNLSADRDFSFQYLATYFPRTFAEICSVFDWLFTCDFKRSHFNDDMVRILDVGCGSGAATMGLIWSMKKARLDCVKKVLVIGLDGNDNYLDRFRDMIPSLKGSWPSIDMDIRLVKVDDIPMAFQKMPTEAAFDFIVSSKFVQEIRQEDAFKGVTSECLKRLNKNGTLCMLENYREGRTESNCLEASRNNDFQVLTSTKMEFSIKQIPNCTCVRESVGYQFFLANGKEGK